MPVSSLDVCWAAGFLEGEGSFSRSGQTITVQCGQVQQQPLEKLQSIFGGAIYAISPKRERQQPYGLWAVSGQRAAEVMMTVWSLMSPRRKEQIEKQIEHWKGRPGASNQYVTQSSCKHGHPFEGDNLRTHPVTGHRSCRACGRARAASHRRRQSNERTL